MQSFAFIIRKMPSFFILKCIDVIVKILNEISIPEIVTLGLYQIFMRIQMVESINEVNHMLFIVTS